jgi:hypothetical protein
MPNQRTRAVINAGEFLRRLASPYGGGIKGVRKEIREEARSLLRHYPLTVDLLRPDAWCSDTAREFLERTK